MCVAAAGAERAVGSDAATEAPPAAVGCVGATGRVCVAGAEALGTAVGVAAAVARIDARPAGTRRVTRHRRCRPSTPDDREPAGVRHAAGVLAATALGAVVVVAAVGGRIAAGPLPRGWAAPLTPMPSGGGVRPVRFWEAGRRCWRRCRQRGDRCLAATQALGAAVGVAAAAGSAAGLPATKALGAAVGVGAVWRWLPVGWSPCRWAWSSASSAS